MQNIAPETLVRWSKQGEVALRPHRNLKAKLAAIVSGKEELSDLARYEKQNFVE